MPFFRKGKKNQQLQQQGQVEDQHHGTMEIGNGADGESNTAKSNGNVPTSSTPERPYDPFFSPVVGTVSREYSVASYDDDDDDEQEEEHNQQLRNVNRPYRNRLPLPTTVTPRSHAAAYDIDDLLGISNDDDQLQQYNAPLLLFDDDEHDHTDDEADSLSRRRRRHHRNRNFNAHVMTPPLNGLNYLNVITYGINVFVSYGIGYAGLFGVLPTRWEILKHYETLVTPAEFAYYLWVPILIFECIFAVAQLFPYYRQRPIIQEGTGLFFFYTCILQTAWTLFFAFRLFLLSFVAAVGALLCLASLLASQQWRCLARRGDVGSSKTNLMEYWLFRFPFYIHAGWLIMCSVVQWSILFRYYTSDVGVQLAADIVALGVMLPPSTFFLTGQPSGPDFVIPLVIVWSYVSIGLELSEHPTVTLQELYGHDAIVAVRDAAYLFAGMVVLLIIPRGVIWIAQEFCTISVIELTADEGASTDFLSSSSAPPPELFAITPLPASTRSSSRRVSFFTRPQVEDDGEDHVEQAIRPDPYTPPTPVSSALEHGATE